MPDAHSQNIINHYVIAYPAHDPRASDPHYGAFNAYHRAHSKTAVCDVGRRTGFDQCADAQGLPMLDQPGHPGIELHHKIIEFSLVNGVDIAAVIKDFPDLSDAAKVADWCETEPNFVWYCLGPDTPILMASGEWRAVADVHAGEWVIGGDGLPDQVLAHVAKPYSGDLFKVGPATLTPTHRIATDRGWIPVGQVANEVRVGGSDVVRVACVDDEVDWSVVRPIPVDVMDALGAQQRSAKYLLRDDAMLHTAGRSHVAPTGPTRRSLAEVPLRQLIESREPALVGAEAFPARSPVGIRHERVPASLANERRPLGWLAIDEPVRTFYSGLVHDLNIAHSHAFVAGGIVVHNCAKHHRGVGGVHHAAAADFQAELYIRDLIGPFEKQGAK